MHGYKMWCSIKFMRITGNTQSVLGERLRSGVSSLGRSALLYGVVKLADSFPVGETSMATAGNGRLTSFGQDGLHLEIWGREDFNTETIPHTIIDVMRDEQSGLFMGVRARSEEVGDKGLGTPRRYSSFRHRGDMNEQPNTMPLTAVFGHVVRAKLTLKTHQRAV